MFLRTQLVFWDLFAESTLSALKATHPPNGTGELAYYQYVKTYLENLRRHVEWTIRNKSGQCEYPTEIVPGTRELFDRIFGIGKTGLQFREFNRGTNTLPNEGDPE